MTNNLRHEIRQSNKGRLQERRGRLQNVLEQRRQAEPQAQPQAQPQAEASSSTQTFATQEESEIKVQSAKKGGTRKMSRAQIREDAEKREAIARGKDPAAKGLIKSE